MNLSLKKYISRTIVLLLILVQACGVPGSLPTAPEELDYRYDDLPSPGSEGAAFEQYRAISKWSRPDITYTFSNGTEKLEGDTELELVRQAFDLWASQTSLTFTEVTNGSEADIVIGWASGDHGDGDPFDGPGDVLAHASFPNPYQERLVILHFDDDERWVDSDTRNVDLLTVAAHEIGHTLGLGHSNDPDALMYAAYSGPRRFLSPDDVAGIQDLYGAASEPVPPPDVPENETPPAPEGTDTDQDGISDDNEVLVTGTDPNSPDSDGDGLGDGVEVMNRMNPLDPDMDRDGISDGQEVAQGSNPFFPEQSEISPALEEDVSDFLTTAIQLEIEAYRTGSAEVAVPVMAGDVLATLESNIASLNQQGLVVISEIDYYESFIKDIRVIDNTTLEVDTCEVWTSTTYSRTDGQLISSEGPALTPQTITIQQLDSNWYITGVQFFEPPAFC
jgi:hypothetical protein